MHRTYGLSLEDGVLRLWRDGDDFSQRYSGAISDDGTRIDGAWEIAEDGVRNGPHITEDPLGTLDGPRR